PPRPAQDGRPPPQSAGLPAEEGCGALPRPDRYAGSAQVISMNEGQAPCKGACPLLLLGYKGDLTLEARPPLRVAAVNRTPEMALGAGFIAIARGGWPYGIDGRSASGQIRR